MSNLPPNENNATKNKPNDNSIPNSLPAQNQDFLNHFLQSQYSSMSGTTEFTSDLFLDEELNSYHLTRVRNNFS